MIKGHFISRLLTFVAVCVQVSLPESEMKAGLALQPQELEVSLVDRPLTDLLFTQFMASVSGKVHCLGKGSLICPNTSVSLPECQLLVTSTFFLFSCKHAASCDDLSVALQPVSRQGERRAVTLPGSGDTLSFSFDNVLPGKYKGQDSWLACFFHSIHHCCVLYIMK